MANGDESVEQTLRRLPTEVEWVRFARSGCAPARFGHHLAAVANSARLAGKPAGYLVFGVEDRTRAILGTEFDPHRGRGKSSGGSRRICGPLPGSSARSGAMRTGGSSCSAWRPPETVRSLSATPLSFASARVRRRSIGFRIGRGPSGPPRTTRPAKSAKRRVSPTSIPPRSGRLATGSRLGIRGKPRRSSDGTTPLSSTGPSSPGGARSPSLPSCCSVGVNPRRFPGRIASAAST